MADSERLKSQFELAMERFKETDAERTPPTEAQKAAIAELRNIYEAKLAEITVLHNGRQMSSDPLERDAREEAHRHERAQLVAERDAKIQKVRDGRA